MVNLSKSEQDRFISIMKRANSIAYESNSARQGWELHLLDTDIIVTNPADIFPDKYYLGEIYLPSELFSDIINISEGLPQWVNTFLTGRTSIENMLKRYTIDNMERIFTEAEAKLTEAETLRDQFRIRQVLAQITS